MVRRFRGLVAFGVQAGVFGFTYTLNPSCESRFCRKVYIIFASKLTTRPRLTQLGTLVPSYVHMYL